MSEENINNISENTEPENELEVKENEEIIEEAAEEAKEETVSEETVKTDDDEIKEFNREVLGKLDSPLVVHKKSDASYEEDTSAFEMNQTHTEEEKPTLQRHRFKKEQKSKAPAVLCVLIIIVIICGIFAGLYYTDNLPFLKKEESTSANTTTESTTLSLEEKYAGTIVVKDTYIFVDGEEVDGLEGLQSELKYEDKSTTAYRIIDEHANSNFLNFNVLTLLEDMGFYDEKTEISHIESTGLIAYEETTTLPPSTTKKSKSKKKSSKSKKSSSKKKSKKGN